MKIDTIYINTHKYDFALTKICVASIRYWYPAITIILIKDLGSGKFNTRRIEKEWNVEILKTSRKVFGWGFGKLEPLFAHQSHSFMVLDADTVITGPVLNNLMDEDAQFIVDKEIQPLVRFNQIYYEIEKIKHIDPTFTYPGYSFNSGQWFGTSGILTRSDFEKVLHWSVPPRQLFPKILFNGEQGILNYVLHRKEQNGEIKLVRKKIMIWPDGENAGFLELAEIKKRNPIYPFVIHWAGMKSRKITGLPRADILLFYENFFYENARLYRILDKFINVIWNIEKKGKILVLKIKSKIKKNTNL